MIRQIPRYRGPSHSEGPLWAFPRYGAPRDYPRLQRLLTVVVTTPTNEAVLPMSKDWSVMICFLHTELHLTEYVFQR